MVGWCFNAAFTSFHTSQHWKVIYFFEVHIACTLIQRREIDHRPHNLFVFIGVHCVRSGNIRLHIRPWPPEPPFTACMTERWWVQRFKHVYSLPICVIMWHSLQIDKKREPKHSYAQHGIKSFVPEPSCRSLLIPGLSWLTQLLAFVYFIWWWSKCNCNINVNVTLSGWLLKR